MEREMSVDCQIVASQLAAHQSDVLSAQRNQTRRLHYQRHWIAQLLFAENHENSCRFPNEEAAIKLLYLGLQNAAKKWTMPIKNWSLAMNQMTILFEGRMLIPRMTENSIKQNIWHARRWTSRRTFRRRRTTVDGYGTVQAATFVGWKFVPVNAV